MRSWLALVALVWAGCDPTSPLQQPRDPVAEPGGTVLPLEAADPRDGGPSALLDTSTSLSDAAPPPPDPFEPHTTPSVDRLDLPPLGGVNLVASWQWRSTPPPASVPQLVPDAVEAAAAAARSRWVIRVAAIGRMRIDVNTRAQPIPSGSALLARADRYGTLLVWPGQARYRVLVPGALRNVLAEHRADVSPSARGLVEARGHGERFGAHTRRVLVSSSLGRAELELAAMPETGLGGPLLCRLLLEIVGVDPGSEVCVDAEVPVAADIAWAEGGGVRFEVEDVDRAMEYSPDDIAVPPRRAGFVTDGLPGATRGVFFEEEVMATFRTEAVPRPNGDPAPDPKTTAENRSDRLLYLVLDGVPLAAVPPWQSIQIHGLKPGRYSVQWRSFLGDIETTGSDTDLPGTLIYSPRSTDQADAG